MIFTIILPVYGCSPWLDEALKSVIQQESRDWRLIIADDGSDTKARHWLQSKLGELKDQRIQWIQRPVNLGLFKNLNQTIREAQTDWILLLCSDDKLHENAITTLGQCHQSWPEADLILSSFESINADGGLRHADSSRHHDQLRIDTGLVSSQQMVPELLHLGSLNGNLTGMAFSKEHWLKSGPFREDWRHAGDWEWMIRASEAKPLLLNRKPIASVRTHEQQLSVRNRLSGHECREVAEVVSILLRHPLLDGINQKHEWARDVMQYQLWNQLKAAGQGDWSQLAEGMKAIHKSSGLRQTGWAMLRWLPERWKRKMKPNAH